MSQRLGFALHALTARLDRAADRMLQEREGLSYSRFMALFWIGELGSSTQRDLAARLGVTEPSVSRMVAVLSDLGLVAQTPAKGNRRALDLTSKGDALVRRSRAYLEGQLESLITMSGVPYETFASHIHRLVDVLERQESAVRRLSHVG
ncbi:MAG TPA: MarR family winged helix-turn-helix transcriptional regulator [Phenylobacterium sp.]|nr:MarR family winged helix-turn-helix transcriptional regulator [Phenylobacterium sp.]